MIVRDIPSSGIKPEAHKFPNKFRLQLSVFSLAFCTNIKTKMRLCFRTVKTSGAESLVYIFSKLLNASVPVYPEMLVIREKRVYLVNKYISVG